MALKTKRLAKVWYLLANLVTFMKFRGPQALVDNYGSYGNPESLMANG
jgi:hypothetical protein